MEENKPKKPGKSWGGKSLNDQGQTPIDNNVGTRIYQWKDGFTTTVKYEGKGPTTKIDWSKRGL